MLKPKNLLISFLKSNRAFDELKLEIKNKNKGVRDIPLDPCSLLSILDDGHTFSYSEAVTKVDWRHLSKKWKVSLRDALGVSPCS